MAHDKEQQANNQQNRKANNSNNVNSAFKKGTPMIVERVNRYPMVNFALSVGFSQYDKLKSSNVTVGDVMSKAEGWVVYVWHKVEPIIQNPMKKADQLACNTLDFFEDKLDVITKYKRSPSQG